MKSFQDFIAEDNVDYFELAKKFFTARNRKHYLFGGKDFRKHLTVQKMASERAEYQIVHAYGPEGNSEFSGSTNISPARAISAVRQEVGHEFNDRKELNKTTTGNGISISTSTKENKKIKSGQTFYITTVIIKKI